MKLLYVLLSLVGLFFVVPLGSPGSSAKEAISGEFKRIGFSIGLRDISDNMVQFTLDGITFRIPISQLYTILENNQYAPDEIRGGFTMVGLWPGFEQKTKESIGLFTSVPTKNNSVRVTLERFCRASDNPEIALQDRCKITTGMHKLYDSYGWNTSFPQWYRRPDTGENQPARILDIPDMEYQGYRIENSDSKQRRASRLIYKGLDEQGNIQFAECSVQSRQDHFNCTIWTPWRDSFFLAMTFREAFLPKWQAIHTTVLERLESYIVTDETPSPPSNIHWTPFP